jgi:hypothetical protein
MSGLVYMGEYSSACVCEAPGHTANGGAASASASAAAVGVIMQMRKQEDSNNDALNASMTMPH